MNTRILIATAAITTVAALSACSQGKVTNESIKEQISVAQTASEVPDGSITGSADYTAKIGGEDVVLEKGVPSCQENETGTTFNVSNFEDYNDWMLQVVLTPDRKLSQILYGNAQEVKLTLPIAEAKKQATIENTQITVDGKTYHLVGEGTDINDAPVPFDITFTCN